MNKFISLIPLMALACGASTEESGPVPFGGVTVVTHPDAQYDDLTGWSAPPDPMFIRDGDPVMAFESGAAIRFEAEPDADPYFHEISSALTGDYGQAREALTVPSAYGLGGNQDVEGCGSTGTCYVGKDKQIRPAWGAGNVTTHPATPGVDYKVEMGHAIQRLQAQHTNWSIQPGDPNTTHDFLEGFFPFSPEVLGDTTPWDFGSQTCSGSLCWRKYNGCLINLVPDQIGNPDFGYCDTVANCQFYAETVIQHELTHCLGMDHSQVSVGAVGSYMRAGLNRRVDTNMNATQIGALNGYSP